MKEPTLSGPNYLPSSGNIKSIVVFLHGFGADGQDLISLAPFFAQHLPHTAFYAPNGPEPCEISPFGRQWFSLAKYDGEYGRRKADTQEAAFEAMYDGAQSATDVLNSYIDQLCAKHSLSHDRVALVGFSQGTMMALHLSMRQKNPFARLVGFSGALVGASKLAKDKTSQSPVLLIHGESDEMLPVYAVELAEQQLHANGITPQILKRPNLPHSIDQEGAEAAALFLSEAL